MRKDLTILCCLLATAVIGGCGPAADLENRFKQVVYFNGISEFEAKTIAEMKLVHSTYKSYYQESQTRIRRDEHAQKYSQFWFVDFSLELLFDAPSYLVVIDKTNGDIVYAGEYFPKKIKHLDWVVERLHKYGAMENAPDDAPRTKDAPSEDPGT